MCNGRGAKGGQGDRRREGHKAASTTGDRVPKAKQAGKTPASRACVEAAVWSERMLAALKKGGVEKSAGSFHRAWVVLLGNGPASELPIPL